MPVLLAFLFLAAVLGAGLFGREAYRVFALRHGLRDLAAHGAELPDETVRDMARLRALALGMALEDEEGPEVATEWDESGVRFRVIRLEVRQPVQLGAWPLFRYPVRVDIREVVRGPVPRPE